MSLTIKEVKQAMDDLENDHYKLWQKGPISIREGRGCAGGYMLFLCSEFVLYFDDPKEAISAINDFIDKGEVLKGFMAN